LNRNDSFDWYYMAPLLFTFQFKIRIDFIIHWTKVIKKFTPLE